ncbi:ABC transporter ATP-binding protein [Oceanobacillus sp. J11TS1]|uniref:ABC transporter ATP-binding protein n=1 Tax=Oceanobacillus sp. J11TS1 TaxID=2807191 RepID=UPI001B01E4FC|nr:ABC transporter ATP-binding protein [Oceanobacillus sp. J11TS1]GIO21441.1 ABC transporter ATP-binding protein [Oceanobacillus sp. J11TS1]
MGELVSLRDIRKSYGRKEVLKGISLSIEPGQVIAVLGSNGTGKSTFLRIIAGIESLNAGQVLFTNNSIRIGYVPERFPKNIRFTPVEYLHYIGEISGIPAITLKERIPSFLQRFGLDQFSNRRIGELSKGNIQKVGIVQAILQPPDLLILDEPVSGLDAEAQQELLKILKELKASGTTILLTYHESNIFECMVDRTYEIKEGLLYEGALTKKAKEDLKLIEVKHVESSTIQGWNDILRIEEQADSLLLFVGLENSDQVLARVLEAKGNVVRVVTVEMEEIRKG